MAVTTATKEDSQALLNAFTKWCHWAQFKVTADMCLIVGIEKNDKTAAQFKPYRKVNNVLIGQIKLDHLFKYLDKSFSYSMSTA